MKQDEEEQPRVTGTATPAENREEEEEEKKKKERTPARCYKYTNIQFEAINQK